MPQSPTTAAYQRWFPFCPTTTKPWAPSVMGQARADFSPTETCKHPDQCCYVAFVATACR